MGVVCCGGGNNIEVEIKRRIINPKFSLKNKIYTATQLVTLLQSYYRRHYVIKKFKNEIEALKEQIFTQLDEKKLINEDIISESMSEKVYQNLLLNGKIKSYMEIANNNKKIKNNLRHSEKYTFFIPNYIVASPKEVYKGSWNLNKKYHGYGVKYEFDQNKNTDTRTEGTFNNGLLLGCGRIIMSNGEIFFGEFSHGKMVGYGEYQREDGSKYEGQFVEGVPHGKGTETMADGSTFEGVYFGGIRKQGKITWKDGSSYEGFFENNKFNGKGKYNWGNQRQYEGEWKDGKMNGKGILTYSDGSYYEGDFINGKKHGQGKYVWEKDKYYIGGWKNDKQNGKGIYNKFGKEIKGFWSEGHLFSKTVDSYNNLFKNVRKRPTLGAYSYKNKKIRKIINESSEQIKTCRTNLESGKMEGNIKNNNNDNSKINNNNSIINKNTKTNTSNQQDEIPQFVNGSS
jgi:hypothetical protein